ncbi:MAG: CRISPR system precrRNA processing endoribonuclease RAMP protein Cas6 [Acidobacteria bacterium]|nr:CRISPR system precrRNA processing endoribonuclease RAMP protein Cas6 [Acidobacteriota bacterium]
MDRLRASLTVLPIRAVYKADRPYNRANPGTALRGALGHALKGTDFGRTFFDAQFDHPHRTSGYKTPPKPFVLRPQIDGTENWSLTIHCFDEPRLDLPSLSQALERLQSGCKLIDLDVQPGIVLPLPKPQPSEPEPLIIDFLTPTHIGGTTFRDIVHALRQRLQPLVLFYGQNVWAPCGLSGFLAHTEPAAIIRSAVAQSATNRTSARTGQSHPITGITGRMDYHAPWRGYEAWLEAGKYTGIGKHTQFGSGVFRYAE